MIKCYAFKYYSGDLDVDSISESMDGVRTDVLESTMGWRFKFPDRYSQDEKWTELLGYGKIVEVMVIEVGNTFRGEKRE